MLQLQVLGSLELHGSDGRSIQSVLAQPKRFALLVYLVLHQGFSRRDTLLPIFWPESDQEHARGSLRQAIRHLRRSLGAEIIIGRGEDEVGIAPESIRCDALDVLTALRAGRYEEAFNFYSGEFVPGLFLEHCPGFEHWARRQLSLADTDETALRRFLIQLEKLGDRTGAVAAYEDFRIRVQRDLHVDPSPETQALIERVRCSGDGRPGEAVEKVDTLIRLPDAPGPLEDSVPRPPPSIGSEASPPPPEGHRRRIARQISGVVSIRLAAVYASLVLLVAATIVLARPASTDSIATLAVLPLVDISEDTSGEYLSDGITEELINALGGVPGLSLASRTSSFSFKGAQVDVREIGESLDVGHVLEGSLLKYGDRLRISLRLVNASDGRQRWTHSYDRQITDVFVLQEDIGRAIVLALRGELAKGVPPIHQLSGTTDVAAYDSYLRGRYLLLRRGRENLELAIAHFRAAIAADDEYAKAYAALADAYIGLTEHVQSPAILERAKAAADRAVYLDESLPEAHLALANVLFRYKWDWEGAERQYRRALVLAPEMADAHFAYSRFLRGARRFDESLREVRLGLDLTRETARDPIAFEIEEHQTLGKALYDARRYSDARTHLERALEMDPSATGTRVWLMLTHVAMADTAGVIRQADRVRKEAAGQSIPLSRVSYAYGRVGRTAEAREIITDLEDRARREYIPKDQLGRARLGVGDLAEALRWYRAAVADHHWTLVVMMNADIEFESIRRNPEFRRLLAELNAPGA